MYLSSRSLSGGFSLVGFIPYLLMCRCLIVVLIYFPICLFINPAVRPGQVFSKPSLIALTRIVFSGVKIVAWRRCASFDLVVWSINLFDTTSDLCVSRGTSHIHVCLFLVPFIICCPFFGLPFLAFLLWWLIHHRIRLLMICVCVNRSPGREI